MPNLSLITRIRSRIAKMIAPKVKISPFVQFRDASRYQMFCVELFGLQLCCPDGPSFYYSHREIFEQQIYAFTCARENPSILDCGANIGLSVIYFKRCFPAASIIAIEADPTIFAILKKNLASFELTDVDVRNLAISTENGETFFLPEGADGGRIVEASCGKGGLISVPAVGLDKLISQPIDFLKIDIEGAETSAVMACSQLHLVDRVFVEYHSFEDQPQRLDELLCMLRTNGFRYSIHQQFAAAKPFVEKRLQLGMDLQLNIFAWKTEYSPT